MLRTSQTPPATQSSTTPAPAVPSAKVLEQIRIRLTSGDVISRSLDTEHSDATPVSFSPGGRLRSLIFRDLSDIPWVRTWSDPAAPYRNELPLLTEEYVRSSIY
jgi:hypothetical protein